MFRERVLSGVVLGLLALFVTIAGGGWFALAILIVFGMCLIEFAHLVARRGHRAFGGLMLLWHGMFVLDRVLPDTGLFSPGTALLLLITMAWTLVRFRQGTANAVTGFAMTLAGSFYIGWTSTHFISLRALDDGLFWVLTVLFAVMVSDTAAYLIGKAFGRTPLIRDVSPRKTWEGYLAGIVAAPPISAALTLLWQQLGASASVSPDHGLVIGALISIIGPLGDLGISMLKRYTGAKDTSRLIPGHGGFLDRVDVLIVAGLLCYYYLTLVVL